MPLIQFPHGIDYPDNDRIPLPVIAATLLAHERFLPVVVQMLEELIPGVTVEESSIYIDELRSGSLKEAFYVAILMAYQKDLEKDVPSLFEHLTGQRLPDGYDSIVTVLFVCAIYAVATSVFDRVKKKTAGPVGGVEAEYLAYVQIVAEKLGVTRDQVEAALRKVIPPKRSLTLARPVLDFFRPAKHGGNGRILPRNSREISKETVEAFPTDLLLADLDKDTVPVPVERAILKIRATDRDKADKGWAGKLKADDFDTKRLPVVLAPDIDQDALALRSEASIQAVLESKITETGGTKPYRIHVMKVLD